MAAGSPESTYLLDLYFQLKYKYPLSPLAAGNNTADQKT